jgi:hypothetical protein
MNIPITKIRPNNYNPNEMTDAEFKELVHEVKHLGKPPKPIVLRKKEDYFEIVDGEHSYRALKEIGIQEIQQDWYELVNYDDIEARRQTYKRNLGGKNNPVKLGMMFAQAIEESGLSNRKLAEQWEVSEGMVRNNLLYAEAGKLRSDYANLAQCTNDQIRLYVKIAEYAKPIADFWLYCGGLKDALLVLDDNVSFEKAGYDVMATFQKLCERVMTHGYYKVMPLRGSQKNIPFNLSQKDKEQNIKKFKDGFNRALSVSQLIERIQKNFIWDEKVTSEYILEYLSIYYQPQGFMPDLWVQTIICTTIRKVDAKYEFMLTPDEIKDCMTYEMGKEGLPTIIEKLKQAIKKKHGIPTYQIKESRETLEYKLDKLEIENSAPDYIKNYTLIPSRLRRVFIDIEFDNDEARKEAWALFIKSYNKKNFANVDLSAEALQKKINNLANEAKQEENRKKEKTALLSKSGQELAELFVEKLRPLTKGDQKFEKELVPKLVQNFSREYLYLFVWLATQYYNDMKWKAFITSLGQKFDTANQSK